MDIEKIKQENLEIAKNKGFGVTVEEVNVPEKFVLIHSEISEAYEAWEKNNLTERHGVNEEIADIFLRTLHLVGIFNILIPSASDQEMLLPRGFDGQIAVLHKITSQAYENYRQKREPEFFIGMVNLVFTIIKFAELNNINLEAEVQKKIELNKTRTWNKDQMNEEIK